MQTAIMIGNELTVDSRLEEMLGTFLLVSAMKTTGEWRLRDAAAAFNRWALNQPVLRLASAYEQLIDGHLMPEWEELEALST